MSWDPTKYDAGQRHAASMALQYALIEVTRIRKALFGAMAPISEFDRQVTESLASMIDGTDPVV